MKRKRTLFDLAVRLLLTMAVHAQDVTVTDDPSNEGDTLLVASLNGQLTAISGDSGDVLWQVMESPVVEIPLAVKRGLTFLPDPIDGQLYILGEGRVKKLPFSIPQLVAASPCKSSDGLLYAGQKKDSWIAVDFSTGERLDLVNPTRTQDKVCPILKEGNAIFVGRTQYVITMYDGSSGVQQWNATFSDYSAHTLQEDTEYHAHPHVHYSSSSDGRLISVDALRGNIMWTADVGSPVVGLYVVKEEGLARLRPTVLGKETLDTLLANASEPRSNYKALVGEETTLFPTLFIGEFAHGLYAIASLVDSGTVTIVPRLAHVPLLEGPAPLKTPPAPPHEHDRSRPHVTLDPDIVRLMDNKEVLLLGYHEVPALQPTKLIINRRSYPSKPRIDYEHRQYPGHIDSLTYGRSKDFGRSTDHGSLKVVLGSVFSSVAICVVIVWFFMRHVKSSVESQLIQTSNGSNSSRVSSFAFAPGNWFRVGNISYDPGDLLGHGCDGTVVYRGRFDGRDVAVKRVVADFFVMADREVSHLRESDEHQHVIRYFCMEADSQFRYIALELCNASLQDYVDQQETRDISQLAHKEILQHATSGLAHLHSLNIVHRDLKPQNVLLTVSPTSGKWRVVISDFGLCKKLPSGRFSFSQRSGTAGTDGWMAPEALVKSSRMTNKADIFSLGCVFYYVLTLGKHPFGDSFHRQANISHGMARYIVERMIQREPADRPPCSFLLKFPFFWNPARTLAFYQDVSDRVEKDLPQAPIVRSMERGARFVVGNDWRDRICPALQADLRKFRTYRTNTVRDLLRAMRNKKHHYRELPYDLQMSLGTIPDGVVRYFESRFPRLLLHVYLTIHEHVTDESVFQTYYQHDYRGLVELRWDEFEL